MSKDNKQKKAASNKKAPKKADALQQQIEALTSDLQRVQADFINYKRRTDEEKQAMADFGRRDIIAKLLPVIDNINLALGHIPDDLANNEWVKGVSKVQKQLQKELENLEVKQIPSVGAEFNPDQHEAVSLEEGEGDKEIVSEELQAGYTYKDTVIRPAYVKVKRSK